MIRLILFFFKVYDVLSATWAPHCRYIPTCSQYSREAIEKFGISKGSTLALKRIFACHPFTKRAIYDPV